MASLTPDHPMPLAPLFLLVLATFVFSVAGSEHARVLEEEQYARYRVPPDYRQMYLEDLCMDARWPRPCQRVLATIPELEYKLDRWDFVFLIPHVIANRTAEAKALADPLLAAAVKKGGELPRCLAACAASLDDVSKVMSGLPAEIDDERYPKVESFLNGLFKSGAVPPLCKSGCPDKSCSVEEKTIADKFHAIWALLDCVHPYAGYYSPPPPPSQR
ncbi:hypothetical protein E2562_003686 [Oryza meyeriana var. granulata]|uniref:Pectinesterase inhibitor domain-containing protein n=1 Tax=Oryza meyeriana var. granulata TaxID=110450 RepID=A0A6G1C3N6_9ORYZ|nr:hypothetical protein E2562_003684 [Oryza meyeriana var. granulata]KAF0894802.1 hypothetical protein E2562_003686 [Oryza meyeriana var. granulata]